VVIGHGNTELTSWPLEGSEDADLALVEELAQLMLVVRRAGYAVWLRNPGSHLAQLIELVGLQAELRVEVSGQAESLEQSGVEEVVVADDAAVGDLDDLDRPR
jgi:hypothetical protein